MANLDGSLACSAAGGASVASRRAVFLGVERVVLQVGELSARVGSREEAGRRVGVAERADEVAAGW